MTSTHSVPHAAGEAAPEETARFLDLSRELSALHEQAGPAAVHVFWRRWDTILTELTAGERAAIEAVREPQTYAALIHDLTCRAEERLRLDAALVELFFWEREWDRASFERLLAFSRRQVPAFVQTRLGQPEPPRLRSGPSSP